MTLLKRVGVGTDVSSFIADEYRTVSVSVLSFETLQYTPPQLYLHKHSPGCIQYSFVRSQ